MLQAALFDMDGVIVDNRDAHLHAFVKFAERHGIPNLDPQTLLPYFGSTNAVIMSHLFGRDDIPAEKVERLSQEKEEIYRELYDPVMQPAPGLSELLKALRTAGVKIAVGSSAPRVNVDFVLDRCGIAGYFDAVASGSEISRSKPDPEVYLLAARKLGTEPQECVVFEDAFVGMEAARRAGAKVVAIASTFPAEMIRGKGDYDLLTDSFRHVTIPELEKLWE
ncbi:HAD family phosphatase [uncultured Rikenella sp.]|uniref:HAD family hydrolase n=1 Tax=uncultured Rikenella sp. TaxID=368003 RepID=UPI00261C32B2|nr:HAD family phosphatase [uncultured Rikenella sp.]